MCRIPRSFPRSKAYDYRTKLTLHVARGRRIGLHPYDRPDQVFDLAWCHITVPELMELWQAVRKLRPFLPPGGADRTPSGPHGGRAHLVVRVGEGEVWAGVERLRRELERRGVPVTIWYQPEGGAARAVAGAGRPFRLPCSSRSIRKWATGSAPLPWSSSANVSGRRVWDLYAGIGETTAQLVARGAIVESVEPTGVPWRRPRPGARRRGGTAGRVEDLLRELQAARLVILTRRGPAWTSG